MINILIHFLINDNYHYYLKYKRNNIDNSELYDKINIANKIKKWWK